MPVAAMSLRTIGSRNIVNLFGRLQAGAARASNVAHMSTQPPSFRSDKGKWESYSAYQFKTKKSGALTAVVGALAAGGIAYAYKSFIGEKISYEVSCAEKKECGKCEDSICLHRLDDEEEMISQANQDFVKALLNVKPKAQQTTEEAVKAYCEAVEATRKFMQVGYAAIMEENLKSPRFEEVWCCVLEASTLRCEKMKDALTKGQCAWELLCRLREIIANAKGCKYTSCNPLLITAEETLLCAERELCNARAKVDCVTGDPCIVDLYREVITGFRADLKTEVMAQVDCCPPELIYETECDKVKKQACCGASDDTDCPKLIDLAYKKVMRAQRELGQTLICEGRVPPEQKDTCC